MARTKQRAERRPITVDTLQDAAEAIGNGTAISLVGYEKLAIQMTGTFVGTVTFEATIDGTNWVAVALADLNSITLTRATSQADAGGLFLLENPQALSQFRARVSAYTSGAVTVKGLRV